MNRREEISRRLGNCVRDLLFASEEDGNADSEREGIVAERVPFVGSPWLGSLLSALPEARRNTAELPSGLDLEPSCDAVPTPVSVVSGPDRLAGSDPTPLSKTLDTALGETVPRRSPPRLPSRNGAAGPRIERALAAWLARRSSGSPQ